MQPFEVGLVAPELHVISDLHLGGKPGFQMFGAGRALAAYIGELTEKPCWLVINGDFVDFLAEEPGLPFDPHGAVRKLRRIAGDANFKQVFDALAAFLVKDDSHRLVIVLGNHDIELALPWVRQELIAVLTNGDSAAAGRLLFSMEGQGFLVRLAGPSGPRVLCVHGNEVDAWNVVDYEKLRKEGREGLRGKEIDATWKPNAGSSMVSEVMNDLKRGFPFVDLLKPETAAVVPTLLALHPAAAGKLAAIGGLVVQRTYDRGRMAFGFLGDSGSAPGNGPPGAPPLSWSVPSGNRALAAALAADLLDRTEARLGNGSLPVDLIGLQTDSHLGLGGAVWNLVKGDPIEALREQLEALDGDRTFSYSDRDETFTMLHEQVSDNIDFLVAGHTHLPRAIEREINRSFYYNTGTWARVLKIKDSVRRDPVAFRALCARLKTARIEELETLDGLERKPPHAAVFRQVHGSVCGELRTVDGMGHSEPVPGTEFRR